MMIQNTVCNTQAPPKTPKMMTTNIMKYGFDESGRQMMVVARTKDNLLVLPDIRQPTIEPQPRDLQRERDERDFHLARDSHCGYDSGIDQDRKENDREVTYIPTNFSKFLPDIEPSKMVKIFHLKGTDRLVHRFVRKNPNLFTNDEVIVGREECLDGLFAASGMRIKHTRDSAFGFPILDISMIYPRKNLDKFLIKNIAVNRHLYINYIDDLIVSLEDFDHQQDILLNEMLMTIDLACSTHTVTSFRQNFKDWIAIAPVTTNELELLELEPQDDYWWDLEPQDDTDPKTTSEAGPLQEEDKSNGVDLIENRGANLAHPMETIPLNVRLIGSELAPHIFPDLTSRWNNIGTFLWSTADTPGMIINTINLPIDVYAPLINNPTTLPFLQYTFFRPNLTLKLQLNATQFHSGLLVMGVQYYTTADSLGQGVRTPITAAQVYQLDYATAFAACVNEVEICIPFQSPLDMIPIRMSNAGSSAYFCTVFVAVVSQLRIGATGSQAVTITRQIKFECEGVPTTFFGQQNREIFLEPQGISLGTLATGASMVGLGFQAVGGLVKHVIQPVEALFSGPGRAHPATNMDRPLLPLDSPNLIRYPVGSLSNGVGVFSGRSLRLDPSKTSPHHKAQIPSNGTILSAEQIASKWGYVTSVTISTTNEVNDLLLSIPVTPLQVANFLSNGMLLTPMGGVANCYTHWSGSILFKIIVVKAHPHSLRLRLSTNPTDQVSGIDMVNLQSTVQQFEEVTEIDYEVPFMGPTPTLPIVYNGNALHAGWFQCRLESRLISMDSVSSVIDIVVLAKRGRSLKFYIPRMIIYQPLAALAPSADITILSFSPIPVEIYISLIGGLVPGNNLFQRVGIVSSSTSAFEADIPAPLFFLCTQQNVDPTAGFLTLNYAGNNNFPITGSVTYDATQVSQTNGSGTFITRAQYGAGVPYAGTVISLYSTMLTEVGVAGISIPPDPGRMAIELEAQGEERSQITNLQGVPATFTVQPGAMVNGEEFDLRSCLRRFQHYITLPSRPVNALPMSLEIDLTYGHPEVRGNNTIINNLTWLHDAFRFGKGSLRFNIIVESIDGNKGKIRVYHRPPGIIPDPTRQVAWLPYDTVDGGLANSFFGHEVIGNTDTTVAFEVPFYNYTNCVVNGYDPSIIGITSIGSYSFGTLIIVADANITPTTQIRIERAFGDDADLYVFQGWPPTQPISGYENINAQVPFTAATVLNSMPLKLQPQDGYEDLEQDFRLLPQ